MFALHLRRVYHVCNKIVIRNLRGGPRSDIGNNPGLNKRMKAFQEGGLEIEDNDVEEFIEQSDGNFLNVGNAYGQHLNETLTRKHELRQYIVKEKYFKDNLPNFLTWSEKEQIRHLVSEHPDEWTPEKISESFPVTARVVKKLVKFPWKPASEQRIARHDASALRNWRELKEGTLNISNNLKEHFLKFSERSIPPLNRKSIKDDLTQEEKLGEFARIVQKCAEHNDNNSDQSHIDDSSEESEKHIKAKKDMSRTTLEQLTIKIKKRIEDGAAVNLPDKIILDTVTVNSMEVAKENVNKEIELFTEKSQDKEKTELTEYKEANTMLFSGINYPTSIKIPRKVYKKGATYKVNDCFYDDDGSFLYRAIGMNKH